VLYNSVAAVGGTSAIVKVSLDGSSVTSVPVLGLGNDFVELANGNYAALSSDTRTVNGATLRGDQVVEVTPSGTTTTIVSMFDCFDPATSPGDGANGDWTGAAALSVDQGNTNDETDDAFYVSLRNLSTIVRGLRTTPHCDRVIGKAMPTIAFAAGSDTFTHPGGFLETSSELLVLDADGSSASSRVLDYTLDLTANTATESWSYTPNPPLHVTALGHVSSLSGQRRLANWSTAGKIEVVGNAADVVWSLTAPTGTTFGHHVRTSDLNQAANEP
jgi:hypothetical protein